MCLHPPAPFVSWQNRVAGLDTGSEALYRRAASVFSSISRLRGPRFELPPHAKLNPRPMQKASNLLYCEHPAGYGGFVPLTGKQRVWGNWCLSDLRQIILLVQRALIANITHLSFAFLLTQTTVPRGLFR
jgi:hypothetical protein